MAKTKRLRNIRGQYVSQNKLETTLTNQLKDIAKEAEIRIKPLVRDEVVQILREEIRNSYTPATKTGQEVQKYNQEHKHQKKHPYHHTGILLKSIYATIEEDMIKTHVKKDATYEDGTPAEKVYDYLKYGTPKEPYRKSRRKGRNKGKVFKSFDRSDEGYSMYIQQQPHNFEKRARERVDEYLSMLPQQLNSKAWRTANGLDRYIDNVAKKNK